MPKRASKTTVRVAHVEPTPAEAAAISTEVSTEDGTHGPEYDPEIELKTFKRVFYGCVAYVVFMGILTLAFGVLVPPFLTPLLSFWVIEQFLKLNKARGLEPGNWRQFGQLFYNLMRWGSPFPPNLNHERTLTDRD